MSSGHDHHDNHFNEPKPVSFRTPMILALVTMFIILLAVNSCDKKQHGHQEQTGHEQHTNAPVHDAGAAHGQHEKAAGSNNAGTDAASTTGHTGQGEHH